MRFIVIGLGSMGKRRIRLLLKINPNFKIFGVDSNVDRQFEVARDFAIMTYESLQEALSYNDQIDAVLVCTSPIYHADIIMESLNRNLNVFTEINLVTDRYNEIIELAKQKNIKLFLSSTPLYRKEIRFINEIVKNTIENLSYTYHVGQYLPDWHPWEKVSDFFVSNPRTNGCREIFAIELPWIIETFGEVKQMFTIKAEQSVLNLNYPDTYRVILQHETGAIGTISVDVVSRKALREFRLIGDNTYLEWMGTPDSLITLDVDSKEKIYPLFVQ